MTPTVEHAHQRLFRGMWCILPSGSANPPSTCRFDHVPVREAADLDERGHRSGYTANLPRSGRRSRRIAARCRFNMFDCRQQTPAVRVAGGPSTLTSLPGGSAGSHAFKAGPHGSRLPRLLCVIVDGPDDRDKGEETGSTRLSPPALYSPLLRPHVLVRSSKETMLSGQD